MCIWQAVLAKDANPESGVKRATVMSVVENFNGINNIVYTERRFKEVFPDSKVRRYISVLYLLFNSPSLSSMTPHLIAEVHKLGKDSF